MTFLLKSYKFIRKSSKKIYLYFLDRIATREFILHYVMHKALLLFRSPVRSAYVISVGFVFVICLKK